MKTLPQRIPFCAILALSAALCATGYAGTRGSGERSAQNASGAKAMEKPVTIAPLPKNSKRLKVTMIATEVGDLSAPGIKSGDPVLADLIAGKLKVLTPSQGRELLSRLAKSGDEVASVSKTLVPGRKAKFAVARDFEYGVDFYRNPKPDENGRHKYVPKRKKSTETGLITWIAARPTKNSKRVWLDFYSLIREFGGFKTIEHPAPEYDGQHRGETPVFVERKHGFEGVIENGSYFVTQVRKDTQTIHEKVPILGDIPIIGKAFRKEREEEWSRSLVIQVVVENAR